MKNLWRGDRLRSVVAVAGTLVAIFIVLLHLAFLRAVSDKAMQVYALFDADVVMVSDRFQFLYRMADFPAARLRQALSLPGIIDAAAVRIDTARWGAPHTRAKSSMLVIGIDPATHFISDANLRDALPVLRGPRRALLDRRSDPGVGLLSVGETGYIGSQPATIVGVYDLGLPMYASTTAIVANADFALYTGNDPNRIQLGLLRVAPGTDAADAVVLLKAFLPNDVRVFARSELMARESRYFVDVKPLGVMMKAGLLIGLIVGAVALFQIMSSQIEARMRDFAVLRAMGFSASFTYGIGAWQLLLMGGTAFALAWLMAIPVFDLIAQKSHLSLPLDGFLLATAGALCIPMIAVAAIPLLRVGRADPANRASRSYANCCCDGRNRRFRPDRVCRNGISERRDRFAPAHRRRCAG